MVTVRGCSFPEDLLYDVPHHVWYRPEGEDLLRLGMTQVGVALAREVLIFTPKRVGRPFAAEKALATVESAKWAGSVRAGFDGTVVAVNDALVPRADRVNTDCYGAGWLMIVRPAAEDWQDVLVTGAGIAPAYEQWMEDNGFAGCGEA
jgi:glycine cleavage system H protein